MKRSDYLNSPYVAGFAAYLSALCDGSVPLDHSYTISLRPWAKHLGEKLANDRLLRLQTLHDALQMYFWIAEEAEDADASEIATSELPESSNYELNAKAIAALENQLRDALQRRSEIDVLVASTKILDWGKVYRGSLSWLLRKYDAGLLYSTINDGVALLVADDDDQIHRFDQNDLRMDSGTTKIFAFGSNGRSIIYDDRVAAALGLLVVRYLESLPATRRPGAVPEELQFMRGRRSDRNPSTVQFRFPGREKGPGLVHARSNLRANWIINSVVEKLNGAWDSRMIEAALFMIGYKI